MQQGQKTLAEENLLALFKNPYPGRGIIAGLDETGKYLVQVYWIMGRSVDSRNRIFVETQRNVISTVPADPSKITDPKLKELIIYDAMGNSNFLFVVSNGRQTNDALERQKSAPFCSNAIALQKNLRNWQYEPDSPNYTPRITASFNSQGEDFSLAMAILKKSPFSDACDRYFYELDVSSPGLGYCITTYSGDGTPLPSFKGDPYLLPLTGTIKNVATRIWENLNPINRVSLAVRFINIESGRFSTEIINQYKAIT